MKGQFYNKRKERDAVISGNNLSDEQIVELFFSRDERAIKETDRKYRPLLKRIAFNILQDVSDCDECMNDALLALWNRIPPTRPESLRAFSATIIRRIAINRYYRGKRKKEIPTELTVSMEECGEICSSEQSVDTAIDAEELGKLINEFICVIPERKRNFFIGRFWFVEPVYKIAKENRVSESTVYKELSSIRHDLKEFLKMKGVNI